MWSPARIKNIWQWIDVNQSSMWQNTNGTGAVTTTGQLVKRIDDLSGNNNHDTEATNAPTYHATAFQSGKCLRFVGASTQKLTSTSNLSTKANYGFTCYMVYQSSSATNCWCWGVNAATKPFAFFWRPEQGTYLWSTGTTTNVDDSFSFAPAVDTPEIQTFRYNSSEFVMNLIRPTFRCPQLAGATQHNRAATAGTFGVSGLPFVTGSYPAGSFYGTFDLVEKIVIERSVGGAEDAEIRGYLAAKYNIGNKTCVIWTGDSLTDGTGGTETSTSLPHKAAAILDTYTDISYIWHRNSYPGRRLYQLQQEYDNDLRPHLFKFSGSTPKNIVPIWFGANDVYFDGADTALANLREACDRITKDGGVPIPCTLINRGDAAAVAAGFNASRLDFNEKLRKTYREFAPALIDYGADSVMGTQSVVDNLTYFQADKIHPTAAGNQLLAQVAAPVIRSVITELSVGTTGMVFPVAWMYPRLVM